MLIPQMAIDPHCQRAAVFVAKPSAHRRNVHARFDAARGKEVPEVVVGDAGHPNGFGCPRHGRQTLLDLHYWTVRRFFRAFTSQPFEQLAHVGDHLNAADSPVLCARVLVAANNDLALLYITVRPFDCACLRDSTAGKGKESDEVSTFARVPAIGALDLLQEPLELVCVGQGECFESNSCTVDSHCRIEMQGRRP